ncbi:MAG: Ig-like domain-containing protein [Lachnospiraceae bacterium]|nr:Ig-like domain-containing protein [Lachnospiraceae bacterium]
MNYKVLLKFGVTMVTAFLMINTYVFANNSQTSETMQLQYIFTDEENTILELVLSQDDGGEAARLINSLKNQEAYNMVLEQVLDIYYKDDENLDSRLIAFSDALDERGAEILKDYKDAWDERMQGSKALGYTPEKILVSFDGKMSTDEVLSCVNSIAAGGTIISSVDLDKEKTVVVMLKKSQTTEKAISLFETIEGVLHAERNKIESLVTPVVPALTLNKQVLSLRKKQSKQLTATLSEGKSEFVWESRNPSIAKVDKNGKVTGISKGTTLIVVTCADNEEIFAMCAVQVSDTEKVTAKSNVIATSKVVNGYNNMIITGYSQMKKLIEKYKVSVYKDKKILNQMNKYDEAFFKKYSLCLLVYQKTYGYKISIGDVYLEQKSGGTYKLNVSLNVKEPDRTKGYPQIMKTHFCFVEISKKAIIPSKQNINVKKLANRKMKLTWNKDVGVRGYQIQYCTDSRFKDGIKSITIKNNMAVAKTISNLKKGKTYYVRVRSYRNIKLNGKTNVIYGSWSRVKKVK